MAETLLLHALKSQPKSVDLSYKKLQKVPRSIGKLMSVIYIILRNNKLKTLPEEFGKLTQVRLRFWRAPVAPTGLWLRTEPWGVERRVRILSLFGQTFVNGAFIELWSDQLFSSEKSIQSPTNSPGCSVQNRWRTIFDLLYICRFFFSLNNFMWATTVLRSCQMSCRIVPNWWSYICLETHSSLSIHKS